MHTYLYITKDTVPPTTYITAADDDSNQYPAYFTNPAKQAPWLPELTPDPSLPLKPGEKERGYIQLDVEPDVILDGEADVEVLDNVVLEHWMCLFMEEDGEIYRLIEGGELEGDIHIGKEGKIHDNTYGINGAVKLGVAEICGDNEISGTLEADGGASFSESFLDGNIKINGTLAMYITHIYGNVTIDYGNTATTLKSAVKDERHTCFESLIFTLRQKYLADYFYRNYGSSAELTHNWEEGTGSDRFDLELVRTFCLDTVNHIDNCKCGIYLPLYLAVVPGAIQYFNLVDKRHPAPLPAEYEDSNKTIEELEDDLLGEDLLDMSYPETYEDWLEEMKAITGVNPASYLPA